ncbi:cAMP-dependent protein kinase regulator [Aureococcus anophagefferens]|nr:cAMP-dependent protein kinase regulator [Aureococcus anophagefferens]
MTSRSCRRGYYPHQLRKPNQDAWRAGALLVRRSPWHNGAASSSAARRRSAASSSGRRSSWATSATRAILGYVPEEQGQIAVQALSVDQTPYRRDERERVKQYGARIMTVDQVEGREKLHENWGAPRRRDRRDGRPAARVERHARAAGLRLHAVPGDMIAERLGVVADPEIHTHTLRREDKFVVAASGGASRPASRQRSCGPPKRSCARSTAAARRRARAASREDFREVRPVRRVLAKEKRVHLNMSESQKLDPGEVAEFRRKLDTADKLAMMISVMQKELFSAGDVIMRAGDEGDKFYLVDTGEYDVIIRDSSQEPQVVHTYRHAGESFGELSLMYGKPRATIKCVREGVVWTLERLAFRAILMKDKSNSSLIATLSKVEGFKQLSVPQLQRVTDACATETFEPGAYIIKQGDVGDRST